MRRSMGAWPSAKSTTVAAMTTAYPAIQRRETSRVFGPPRQLISSTRQEALKALSREYTIATEKFETPVARLTQPIVGGAAKKNTRPARRISA